MTQILLHNPLRHEECSRKTRKITLGFNQLLLTQSDVFECSGRGDDDLNGE